MNEAQKLAAEYPAGPLLIIAGAGTGKTKTLVHRIIGLVSQGFSPESILLLTFTKRAASEMLYRAKAKLDINVGRVFGGTFHSFCNYLLRKYGSAIGIPPQFTILDIEDATSLIGIAREDILSDAQRKRFPKKESLQDLFSSAFNSNLSLSQALAKHYPQFAKDSKEIQKVKERYESLKKESVSLDFDDLLLFARQVLMEHQSIRERVADDFKAILVDEYQDTNRIQAHIACLLAAEHKNITVVGDEAQSIYGFRGAEVKNILDFPKIFPHTKVLTLEENFRSNQGILDLANETLKKFKETYEKRLYSKRESHAKPQLISFSSEKSEADWIAEKILHLNENGQKFKDIAVLFRSGWHSNLLEIALTEKGIPYRKFGGKKFLENAHIKDVLAYLRLIENPFDQISFHRVLQLEEGIGPKVSALVYKHYLQNHSNIGELSWESLTPLISELPKQAKDSCQSFFQTLLKARSLSEAKPIHFYEFYLAYYKDKFEKRYDDFEKRSKDFESLELIVKNQTSLRQFLTDMSLEGTESSILNTERNDQETEGFVTLSTIHSAKGLEWNSVFVIHLIEGEFPTNKMRTIEDLEEERRLFYVAVTRAKDQLFLSASLVDEKIGNTLKGISRFVSELPKETYDQIESPASTSQIVSNSSPSTQSEKTSHFDAIQNYFLN
ncbi:UvrD/REP helicase N-terminal domain protein [Leptospira ryugenii]|uniref:DNA 3'-5' helicase n=1 Tax=Leptospira ryugenii TaxID=1917863 RepID=A0A2P2DWW7_9LEPT|nr:UvrD/REP helicase N-terminal domain protein [Leptospira ryugenii]